MTALAAPPQSTVGRSSRGRPLLRRVHHEPAVDEPGRPARAPTGAAAPDPTTAPPAAAVPAPVASGPVASGPVACAPVASGPVATHAEARRAVARVLRVALEVLDGRRPATQLAGHADPSVLRCWRVAAQQRRVRSPARARRMRLCQPRPGVAEVALVCDLDGTVRAIAARFEHTPARAGWRCTALRLL